jgi:hypothetical protein
MPPELKDKVPKIAEDYEDPEAPHLARAYLNCYHTIFQRKPAKHDNATRYQKEIINGARLCSTSIRMFILSNMMAHQVQQHTVMDETEKSRATPFHSKLLSGKLALTRCNMYNKLCRKRYGTFSLSSLATLADENYEDDEIHNALLHSEVAAGKFIVSYKINTGGPPYVAFYEQEEFVLNQYWLSIEPTYKKVILDAHRLKPSGSEAIQRHRFDVLQTIGYLKRNRTDQELMFSAREKIMPRAVEQVLAFFQHRPDDFLIEDEVIKDPLRLWIRIGRAIQHYNLYLFLNGEPSFFGRKRVKGSCVEIGKDAD